MKKTSGTQRGFSLVAAIFIIVILALLGSTMVFLGVLQRETVSTAALGARAYHAARSGLEGALFLAVSASAGTPTCASNTYNVSTVPGLIDFTVFATCSSTVHREHATDYYVFAITSSATYGTYGNPAYVERVLRITATNASSP